MHMSFRNRLTFFFILLVILPVLAVALVGVLIVRESEEEKTDSTLTQAQTAADRLYKASQERAERVGMTVQRDQELAIAVRDGERAALQERLDDLAQRGGAVRVRLKLTGQAPFDAGDGDGRAVAPAVLEVTDANGPAGRIALSVTTAEEYANLLAGVSGLDVLITQDDRVIAGTLEPDSARGVPREGEFEVGADHYHVASVEAQAFEGATLDVHVLLADSEVEDAVSDNAIFVVAILLAFLICALAFALTAARSLESQTSRLLAAARNIGRGDFSIEVPTEGHDEFAALGKEFNSMARQLETRLEELQLERARLQETVRRVGESLGKGLDRDALLGIVVQTAVDGVGAECGRVVMRHGGANGTLAEAARAGNISSYMAAVQAAEAAAMEAGEAAETQISGANALARPLAAPEPEDGVLGVISIARPGRPFSQRQRELFEYLTNQAAISIENVDLHEQVQRQAVTDELTGLFNHRRFQEVITAEVERTRRFGQELGLIMLDIDDFKRVNDTYGHLQGDVVLKEVAHALRESSREIDEPARYGGEEMAVALPQTGLQGAYEFAERVRQRIESLQIPLLDGGGTLRVTASFGAASLPDSAKIDKEALVAAVDAALYRAKRSGKNRTVKAG
jgi:diguanylate cyclase (GGDEF)-like protein